MALWVVGDFVPVEVAVEIPMALLLLLGAARLFIFIVVYPGALRIIIDGFRVIYWFPLLLTEIGRSWNLDLENLTRNGLDICPTYYLNPNTFDIQLPH